MNGTKFVWASLVAVVAATVSTAALAAPDARQPLTGVWAGKTHQELPPLGEGGDYVDWEQYIVVKAYQGRLVSLTTNLRYTCPDPTDPRAGDERIHLIWDLGEGPRLTAKGGFSLFLRASTDWLSGRKVRLRVPVRIGGTLGTRGAGGYFKLDSRNCSGKGSWKAVRTSTI